MHTGRVRRFNRLQLTPPVAYHGRFVPQPSPRAAVVGHAEQSIGTSFFSSRPPWLTTAGSSPSRLHEQPSWVMPSSLSGRRRCLRGRLCRQRQCRRCRPYPHPPAGSPPVPGSGGAGAYGAGCAGSANAAVAALTPIRPPAPRPCQAAVTASAADAARAPLAAVPTRTPGCRRSHPPNHRSRPLPPVPPMPPARRSPPCPPAPLAAADPTRRTTDRDATALVKSLGAGRPAPAR